MESLPVTAHAVFCNEAYPGVPSVSFVYRGDAVRVTWRGSSRMWRLELYKDFRAYQLTSMPDHGTMEEMVSRIEEEWEEPDWGWAQG